MGIMRTFAVLLALLLMVSPCFARWKYLGTSVYVTRPGRSSSPDGTWSAGWDGNGTVTYTPTDLCASGWTEGDATVCLTPAFQGSYRYASAWSKVNGYSGYRKVPGGYDDIEIKIQVTVDLVNIAYFGIAQADLYEQGHAACQASVYGYVYGGDNLGLTVKPYGLGSGQAYSTGGSYARIGYDQLWCLWAYADASNEPPIPGVRGPMGWYDGGLYGWGQASDRRAYTESDVRTVTTLSVGTEVGGEASVCGFLWYSPQAWPYFWTTTYYTASGTSKVELVGDIIP